MRIHELKTDPEPFQAVLDGRKTAEFRKNDRLFAVGDILRLREWDPQQQHPTTGCFVGGYTGRELRVEVTHCLDTLFGEAYGIPSGYAMLSFRRLDAPQDLDVEELAADLAHLQRWAGKRSNDDGLGLPDALDRLDLAVPRALDVLRDAQAIGERFTALRAAIRTYAEDLTTLSWRRVCERAGIPADVHHEPGGLLWEHTTAEEAWGLARALLEIAEVVAAGTRLAQDRTPKIRRAGELLGEAATLGRGPKMDDATIITRLAQLSEPARSIFADIAECLSATGDSRDGEIFQYVLRRAKEWPTYRAALSGEPNGSGA